jgi:hypothetical protein
MAIIPCVRISDDEARVRRASIDGARPFQRAFQQARNQFDQSVETRVRATWDGDPLPSERRIPQFPQMAGEIDVEPVAAPQESRVTKIHSERSNDLGQPRSAVQRGSCVRDPEPQINCLAVRLKTGKHWRY